MTKIYPTMRFTTGAEFVFEGRPYRVDRVRNGRLWLDAEKGNDSREFPLEDVPRLFADGVLKRAARNYSKLPRSLDGVARDAEFSQLSADEKATVSRMLAYIGVLESAPYGKKSGNALRDAIAAKAKELGDNAPPCERRIYLYRRRLVRENGDVRVLLPQHKRKGSRECALNQIVECIIDKRIQGDYLTLEEISFPALENLIKTDIDDENKRRTAETQLSYPHITTIRRRIETNYDAYVVMSRRKGTKAANHHFRMVRGGPIYDRPLQMMLIDSCLLHILITHKFGGKPLRPWLVVALDAYSRCVLGFHVSFDPPCRQTTNQCLRHALGYKGYLKEKYPSVRTDWPCHGIPESACTDNGTEFKNDDVLLAMASFHIDFQFTPAGKPYYKGVIERFFRTLNQHLVHSLLGSTRSNPQELGDYPAEERARLTLEDLKEALHLYFCDVYHNHWHRELGASPLQVWLRGCEDHPIEPPPSDEELCILLGNTEMRTVQREGIELFGIRYVEDWLMHLRPRQGESKKVLVRYDPSLLTRIWVLDEGEGEYFPVNVAPKDRDYVRNLSEWEHRQIKREVGEKGLELDSMSDAQRIETLVRVRTELHERFTAEPAKTTKAARRQRRIVGDGRLADGQDGHLRAQHSKRAPGAVSPATAQAELPADPEIDAVVRTVRVDGAGTKPGSNPVRANPVPSSVSAPTPVAKTADVIRRPPWARRTDAGATHVAELSGEHPVPNTWAEDFDVHIEE